VQKKNGEENRGEQQNGAADLAECSRMKQYSVRSGVKQNGGANSIE
jgi:hypothetical protein